MITESQYVICTKGKSLYREGNGIVNLLFVLEHVSWKKPDPKVFQKGRVWIHNNYDLIEKLEDGKIFQLTVYPTKFTEDDFKNSDDYCDWTAPGSNLKTIPDSEFIPVYEMDLPPINTCILDYSNSIPYSRIFIKSREFVYGPFTVVSTADGYKLDPYTLPIAIDADHVTKINFNDFSSSSVFFPVGISDTDIIGFVENFRAFKAAYRHIWELQDFINDSKLITYLLASRDKEDKRKTLGHRNDIQKVLAAISETKYSEANDLAKRRFERGIDILKTADSSLETLAQLTESLFAYYKTTPQFKNALDAESKIRISEADMDQIIAQRLDAERKEFNKQITQSEDRISKLQTEEKLLEDRIDQYTKKLEELTSKSEQTIKSELSPAIKALQLQKDQAESDLASLKESIEVFGKQYSYIQSFEHLKLEVARLSDERSKADSALQSIRDTLSDDKELAQSMGKHILLSNLLQRKNFSAHSVTIKPYQVPNYISDKPKLATDLVSAINTKLKSTPGKIVSDLELANVLICMQQCLITLFHGKPGVGKTSTARRLAHALGLTSNPSISTDDYLCVPVGKGWVKQSDFVGFFNSLTGEFQPARTGMYEFLKLGSQAPDSFRFALLDEMNLSVPEHYMSDIIGMCDPEGRFSPLVLGGLHQQETVTLNSPGSTTTRFIGTLNHDSTTEPLSQRLIDRCPIISFDIDITYPDFSSSRNFDGAVSRELIYELFDIESLLANGVKRIDPPDLPQLKTFLDSCRDRDQTFGNSIDISGRKNKLLFDYLTVSRHIFNEEGYAQDFAVSQFIIPSIKGDGLKFKSRLDRLLDISVKYDWQRTTLLLSQLIQSGETNLNSYSFV